MSHSTSPFPRAPGRSNLSFHLTSASSLSSYCFLCLRSISATMRIMKRVPLQKLLLLAAVEVQCPGSPHPPSLSLRGIVREHLASHQTFMITLGGVSAAVPIQSISKQPNMLHLLRSSLSCLRRCHAAVTQRK